MGEPSSSIIFEQNEVNLKKQVTHLMKAHEEKFSAMIKDAIGLTIDEVSSMDVKKLNIQKKKFLLSPEAGLVQAVRFIRRTLKNRDYAKNSRDKKEKEELELEIGNKKLRQ